ncbi:MAG: AAA family ATPase [Bacteroidales bacterium]|nr:AAA family ATPase [Bacteroidales bacterium]
MKIKNIQINNFRLLEDVSVDLEEDITLIIGKNNTGKTSFFEAIRLFTEEGESKLLFEDFSQFTYQVFKDTYEVYKESLVAGIAEDIKDQLEVKIQNEIPKIQLIIEFEYDKATDSLIELSEFITDLDESRNDASVLIEYAAKDSLRVFQSFDNREEKETTLIPYLKDNIKSLYTLKCFAFDKQTGRTFPIDDSFKRKIQKVVLFENIQAMRVLDDSKNDRNNSLSIGFSNYYSQRDKSDVNVKALEKTLKATSGELKDKYNAVLKDIITKLENFGAKSPITIPNISINSEFDSEKIMKNNIKYYYKQDEIDLPERYNGLGYSNLIYMILELESFVEKFKNNKEEKISNFLVVLIEEPEAHMHPQMQQVFIKQAKGIIEDAARKGVKMQLVITSHSSHILSEAGIDEKKGFKRIRYFTPSKEKLQAKDFNKLKIEDEKRTVRFLKQYLTLHKSDLFFADKVILVEGLTERILLPQMIKKVVPILESEYVSILEVGGAYAHKFKEILEFIETKTLIITDIDSSDDDGEAIPVNEGVKTTNETLKQWVPKKETIDELKKCTEKDKIDGLCRIAYQKEEDGYHARSFEDAFINTNYNLLSEVKEIEGISKKVKNEFSYFKVKGEVEKELFSCDSKVKTNFAFDILTFDEETFGEWSVPQYINEGLTWLAKTDSDGSN